MENFLNLQGNLITEGNVRNWRLSQSSEKLEQKNDPM